MTRPYSTRSSWYLSEQHPIWQTSFPDGEDRVDVLAEHDFEYR